MDNEAPNVPSAEGAGGGAMRSGSNDGSGSAETSPKSISLSIPAIQVHTEGWSTGGTASPCVSPANNNDDKGTSGAVDYPQQGVISPGGSRLQVPGLSPASVDLGMTPKGSFQHFGNSASTLLSPESNHNSPATPAGTFQASYASGTGGVGAEQKSSNVKRDSFHSEPVSPDPGPFGKKEMVLDGSRRESTGTTGLTTSQNNTPIPDGGHHASTPPLSPAPITKVLSITPAGWAAHKAANELPPPEQQALSVGGVVAADAFSSLRQGDASPQPPEPIQPTTTAATATGDGETEDIIGELERWGQAAQTVVSNQSAQGAQAQASTSAASAVQLAIPASGIFRRKSSAEREIQRDTRDVKSDFFSPPPFRRKDSIVTAAKAAAKVFGGPHRRPSSPPSPETSNRSSSGTNVWSQASSVSRQGSGGGAGGAGNVEGVAWTGQHVGVGVLASPVPHVNIDGAAGGDGDDKGRLKYTAHGSGLGITVPSNNHGAVVRDITRTRSVSDTGDSPSPRAAGRASPSGSVRSRGSTSPTATLSPPRASESRSPLTRIMTEQAVRDTRHGGRRMSEPAVSPTIVRRVSGASALSRSRAGSVSSQNPSPPDLTSPPSPRSVLSQSRSSSRHPSRQNSGKDAPSGPPSRQGSGSRQGSSSSRQGSRQGSDQARQYPAASFSVDLWDSFDAASKHVLAGLRSCKVFRSMIRARATAEESYGKELSRVYKDSIGKAKEKSIVGGTQWAAIDASARACNEAAIVHKELASILLERIAKPLDEYVRAQLEVHKSLVSQANRSTKELTDAYNAVAKTKVHWEKVQKEADLHSADYNRIVSCGGKAKEISKALDKRNSSSQKALWAKGEYVQAANAANRTQQQHFTIDMPGALSALQELDQERAATLHRHQVAFSSAMAALPAWLDSKAAWLIADACDAVDIAGDRYHFIQSAKTSKAPHEPFPVPQV